jgi:hypothetical protein
MALIATFVPIAAPAQGVLAVNGTASQWGWVTAREPKTASYTPDASDRGNSSGGVNTVRRTSKGNYVIHMPGLAATGTARGMAHATAMSSARRVCVVDEWFAVGAEEVVHVRCYALNGSDGDSRFTVNFLQARGVSGRIAYAWANQPSAPGSYTPNGSYQYDSKGGSITVNHTGTGRYRVTLPHLGTSVGAVLVAAVGAPAICRFSAVATSGPDKAVTVVCRDLAGALANAQFTITYVSGTGLKGPGAKRQAYVFAKRPTTASYEPAAVDRYSTSGLVPNVQRTGTGKYVVTFPGQKDGGSAHATAVSGGAARCVINYIRNTSAPAQIGIGCYVGDGVGVDVPFTMVWGR